MMIITKLNQTFGEKNFFSFAEYFSLDVFCCCLNMTKGVYSRQKENQELSGTTHASHESFVQPKKSIHF